MPLQQEIDKGSGFNSDHIFYKVIFNAITQSSAKPGTFEWPQDIVDFMNSIESQGGEATLNLLRGPGYFTESNLSPSCSYWERVNIPIPTKRSRQRHKGLPVVSTGILTENVKNFQLLASTSTPLVNNTTLNIVPICLSRDAMAIKPSGDIDVSTETIVGLTEPIDIHYIKSNPVPDQEELKSKMYTEAGALIGTTLDNQCSLLLGNDFLTHRVTGDDVLNTVSNAVKCIQCCEECLRHVHSQTIICSDVVTCNSVCLDCLQGDKLCDTCIDIHTSIYPQLRACSRCLTAEIQCRKIAVLAISMDCESNNAMAMKRISTKDELDSDMLLLHALPDAVHAAKKVFRASANWWLWVDGHRVNNVMLRCLRQFDEAAADKLRPIISDSVLRNRDRMDFATILNAVDKNLHVTIDGLCEGHDSSLMTTTIVPDPFWRAKKEGVLGSITSICTGRISLSTVI